MDSRRPPLEVLLVEDNPGDVRLVREAMREAGLELHLRVAQDGEEALRMLFDKSPEAQRLRPNLILLDLNLPKRSGHEVLQDVKQDHDLRTIPVVVVSSAASKEDINRVYNLCANCYIRKPLDLESTLSTLRDLFTFWFERATLPLS